METAYLGLAADMSSLSLDHGTLVLNVAQGGAGGAGGNGGSGGFVLGITTASIANTQINTNDALGGFPGAGGACGQGIGGGLYIDTGASVTLSESEVLDNFASTSSPALSFMALKAASTSTWSAVPWSAVITAARQRWTYSLVLMFAIAGRRGYVRHP